MCRYWLAPVTIILALTSGKTARAEDQAAMAVVDKAIKAMGGEANLMKVKAATWNGKGKFYGLGGGEGLDYTGNWAFHGPRLFRMVVELDLTGQKVKQTIVVNGDKGWIKNGDMVGDMDKDVLAEHQDQAYANWTVYVNPLALKDKTVDLSLVGDVEIYKRITVGIRVVSKGHRDINLYFDKKTGLLVKGEWRVKDT